MLSRHIRILIRLCCSSLRSSFQGDALSGNSVSEVSWQVQPKGGPLRIDCKESRIGKVPVEIPKGVTVTLEGQNLAVKGPLGELARTYPREVKLTKDDKGIITVERALDTRRARQMHGLFRCVWLWQFLLNYILNCYHSI